MRIKALFLVLIGSGLALVNARAQTTASSKPPSPQEKSLDAKLVLERYDDTIGGNAYCYVYYQPDPTLFNLPVKFRIKNFTMSCYVDGKLEADNSVPIQEEVHFVTQPWFVSYYRMYRVYDRESKTAIYSISLRENPLGANNKDTTSATNISNTIIK